VSEITKRKKLNQEEMPQILLPEQQRTGIGTKRI